MNLDSIKELISVIYKIRSKIKVSNNIDEEITSIFNYFKNLEKYFVDISVLFKKDVDLNIILELLTHKFEIEVIDTYYGDKIDENDLSATFRISSYEKEDLKKLEETFNKIIENIGGKLRY